MLETFTTSNTFPQHILREAGLWLSDALIAEVGRQTGES
jgi:hypothetical protein